MPKNISLDSLSPQEIPPAILLQLINQARQLVKDSETMEKKFEEYQVDLQEIDLIPIYFAPLDVSARTEHGLIYLNYSLLEPEEGTKEEDYQDNLILKISHYLAHEIDHYLQQTTGTKPTQGSNSDDYLENPYEVEGFATQTEFISETQGDQEATEYIDKVLDHHDLEGKERKETKKNLLQLASLISIRKSAGKRISAKVLEFLASLPDIIVDDQAEVIRILIEVGLEEGAEIIIQLSPDQYHDFIVNYVPEKDAD